MSIIIAVKGRVKIVKKACEFERGLFRKSKVGACWALALALKEGNLWAIEANEGEFGVQKRAASLKAS